MDYQAGSEIGYFVGVRRDDNSGSDVAAQLNKVLRGELSAVEAYDQVLDKFSFESEVQELIGLKMEHTDSVQCLKDMVRDEGNIPDEESGVWGAVVKTVIGGAKLFGNAPAINALREGEEHGLKLYRKLLEMNLDVADARLVRSKLIPRQEKHIALLERLAHTPH